MKNCRDCLLVARPTNPAPMNRRVLPKEPWQCLAMDLLGPLPNHDFIFVVIDYYGTTVKAPTELLFNRVIRDKLLSIHDVGENI